MSTVTTSLTQDNASHPATPPSTMTDRERILLGAIGGICVGIAVYPVPGYNAIIVAADGYLLFIGFLLRLFGFALLGGFWAYLNKDEHDRKNVFQLGLVGPAILSALIAANVPKTEVPVSSSAQTGYELAIVRGAYAAPPTSAVSGGGGATPASAPGIVIRRLWQGFTGQTVAAEPAS